ncbi:MAG: protein-disulfide reductase DsbD domain-containing protein [Myxococcota bacterium]
MKVPFQMRTWVSWAAAAVVAVAVVGCEEQETTPEPASDEPTEAPGAAAPGSGETPEPRPEDLGPVVATETYELRAEATGPYASGELGQFVVTIVGKDGWHVNQDFPTGVTLDEAEGVTFPKPKLAKADAAEFGEEKARFDVPVTPEDEGEHRVTADVSFAICTDETCVPQQKKLALLLPVE